MRHTHVGVRATAAVLLVLSVSTVLAACSTKRGDSARRTTTTATSTTTTVVTTTTSATTPPAPPLPAASPGTCPAPLARNQPRPDRPRYTLRVDVKPADNVVTGTVEVVFTPDLPTDHLVFRLWPNGPRPAKAGARLDVTATRIGNGSAPGQRPDATTLTVPVELHAGQSVTAAVDFTLTLPRPVDDRISRTADAIRLGSFFPILSWEPGVGWATEPPTSGFAEASTVQAADFTATVTTPPGFDVLATGVPGPANGQWTAQAVGDFAMSVGHFRTASATTKQGTAVTVGVDAQVKDGPESYVRRIVAALEDYGNRFGPYPWPAYTMAVEPNLQGGIEYPMHVMQGPGTVGRTTPHEVAHQWFYGLVENNQGRDPFLDEGLASWAEARDENTLSRFVGLAVPVAGKGHAGEPMAFWESRQSAYYRSVYVQPVQALAALGPPELVDCALRLYVARNAYRIARPVDLLEALKVVFPNAPATLARYGIAA